jgi:hypothetical protein
MFRTDLSLRIEGLHRYATNAWVDELWRLVSKEIQKQFPAAKAYKTDGQLGEEWILGVNITEITDAEGKVLADNDENQTPAFDALTDVAEPMLQEIAELTGEDLMHENEHSVDPKPLADNPLTLLVTGTPADGFTFYGPVTTNSGALDEFVDQQLSDQYWWYTELQSLPIPSFTNCED